MAEKIVGIDPDGRVDLTDGFRRTGVTAGVSNNKGIQDKKFNEILFKINQDHVLGSAAQLALDDCTMKWDGTNFKDKADDTVTFADNDRITIVGNDTLVTDSNLVLPDVKHLKVRCLNGVELLLGTATGGGPNKVVYTPTLSAGEVDYSIIDINVGEDVIAQNFIEINAVPGRVVVNGRNILTEKAGKQNLIPNNRFILWPDAPKPPEFHVTYETWNGLKVDDSPDNYTEGNQLKLNLTASLAGINFGATSADTGRTNLKKNTYYTYGMLVKKSADWNPDSARMDILGGGWDTSGLGMGARATTSYQWIWVTEKTPATDPTSTPYVRFYQVQATSPLGSITIADVFCVEGRTPLFNTQNAIDQLRDHGMTLDGDGNLAVGGREVKQGNYYSEWIYRYENITGGVDNWKKFCSFEMSPTLTGHAGLFAVTIRSIGYHDIYLADSSKTYNFSVIVRRGSGVADYYDDSGAGKESVLIDGPTASHFRVVRNTNTANNDIWELQCQVGLAWSVIEIECRLQNQHEDMSELIKLAYEKGTLPNGTTPGAVIFYADPPSALNEEHFGIGVFSNKIKAPEMLTDTVKSITGQVVIKDSSDVTHFETLAAGGVKVTGDVEATGRGVFKAHVSVKADGTVYGGNYNCATPTHEGTGLYTISLTNGHTPSTNDIVSLVPLSLISAMYSITWKLVSGKYEIDIRLNNGSNTDQTDCGFSFSVTY